MPTFPETVRLPLVSPLVVARFVLDCTPPWVWDMLKRHELLWCCRRFNGVGIAALDKAADLSMLIMLDALPKYCDIEVHRRHGVEVPLIPPSFFADWKPIVPLLCPPFSNGRLVFSGEPAVRDLVDLADAANFATTYLR